MCNDLSIRQTQTQTQPCPWETEQCQTGLLATSRLQGQHEDVRRKLDVREEKKQRKELREGERFSSSDLDLKTKME